MAKCYDENKAIRSFSRVGSVNVVSKTLKASKTATIGIHMWGKIDYLTHYCGYHFVWDNLTKGSKATSDSTDKVKARAAKKAAKEHKLTDKRK